MLSFLRSRAKPKHGERSESAPRKPITGSLQILGIGLVVGGAIFVSQAPEAEPITVKPQAAREPTPQTVNLIQPKVAATSVDIEATGTIAVRNYVALTPQVTGRIASLSTAMRAGGYFEANEPLLTLETVDFDLVLLQARADVDAAKAVLMLEQAQSDAARANYALLHPAKSVPALVAKLPQIDQAKAQLASAKARLAKAEVDLARTTFSLPFSGRIASSTAEVGQVVSKGQSIGKAFSRNALEIAVPISTAELDRLTPISEGSARFNHNGVEHHLRVDRVSAELDQKTRFATLYLQADHSAALTPGTFVNVQLTGPTLSDTFTLPELVQQDASTVWFAKDGELHRQLVTVRGRTASGLVTDAFQYGDGIVLGAVPGARPGLEVQYQKESEHQLASTFSQSEHARLSAADWDADE